MKFVSDKIVTQRSTRHDEQITIHKFVALERMRFKLEVFVKIKFCFDWRITKHVQNYSGFQLSLDDKNRLNVIPIRVASRCAASSNTSSGKFSRLASSPSVTGFSGGRIRSRLEASELRMMPVALRAARQNLLRQQTFTPERHQSFGVKKLRMNSPQPHNSKSTAPVNQSDPILAANSPGRNTRSRHPPGLNFIGTNSSLPFCPLAVRSTCIAR